MFAAIIGPLLGVIEEGLKIWSEERRTRFLKKYHEQIKELREAQNAQYPHYTDAELDLAFERLRDIVESYRSELREANLEILQSREGRA